MKEGYVPQVRWSSCNRMVEEERQGNNHATKSTIASCPATPRPPTPCTHTHVHIYPRLCWRTQNAIQNSHRDSNMAGNGSGSQQHTSLRKDYSSISLSVSHRFLLLAKKVAGSDKFLTNIISWLLKKRKKQILNEILSHNWYVYCWQVMKQSINLYLNQRYCQSVYFWVYIFLLYNIRLKTHWM